MNAQRILAEDGADCIFITGAPGSKWSIVAYALSLADQINTSDGAPHRRYSASGATHFGNYFGPGMEYGGGFDHIAEIDKRELLQELSRPYREPGGIKLLKSHMFARHLDYLLATFPAASFVLVHRDDEACLDWWLEAGGFDIAFPDYSWYRELANMREQIAVDNRGIVEFAERHGVELTRRRSLRPLAESLDLTYSSARLAEVDASGFADLGENGGAALQAVSKALLARARDLDVACFAASEHRARGGR